MTNGLRSGAGLVGVLALLVLAATAPGAMAQASGPVDLSVVQVASGNGAGGQDRLLFALVVRNQGPSDATGVSVVDGKRLGPRRLIAAAPSQGSCSITAQTFSCSLGALVAGGSAQILLTARVPGSGHLGLVTAAVSSDQPELDPSDNQHRLRIGWRHVDSFGPPPGKPPPPPPDLHDRFDLAIEKRSSATHGAVGRLVTSTIEVVNHGPDPAPHVTVLDTFNAPAAPLSARTTAGTCRRQIPVTCRLGTLDPGERVRITVVVEQALEGCWEHSAASVTARDGALATTTETRAPNNLDIERACDSTGPLELYLDAPHPDRVRAGDTIRYWIEVRNPVGDDVHDVRVCDRLPTGLVYAGPHPGARRARGRLCWTAKLIAGDTRRRFPVRVRVLPGTRDLKRSRITLTAPDLRPARVTHELRVIGADTPGGGGVAG